MKLRKKISEILIKWDMPTRQVAINEIMEVVGEIVPEKNTDHCCNSPDSCADQARITTRNKTIEEIESKLI